MGGGGDVTALRVALAGSWLAVRGRRLAEFPRVLRVLEAAAGGGAGPGGRSLVLRWGHRARLRLGLGAAVVMRLLREEAAPGRIRRALDTFCPAGEGPRGGGGAQEAVWEAQQNFRWLVLGLLGDPARRHQYLQGAAGRDYGEGFLAALEQLYWEFLGRVESALPPPDPRQLEEAVRGHAPRGEGPGRDLPLLRRYLSDLAVARGAAVPRPPPAIGRLPPPPAASRPISGRGRRPGLRPRPLRPPLEFLGRDDVTGGSQSGAQAAPRRRSDADGEGDRDRHRAHRQGGADQGAGGGEGGDPPPAAAPHLQRQADERREDGGRLQDPGGLRPAPGAGAAGRRPRPP